MSDQYDAAAPLIQVALDTDEAVGNSLAALTRALLRVVRAINGNIVIQLGDTAAATKISVLKSNGSEAFWFKSDGTSSISPGGTPVTGSGTLNKLPYWTSSSALGDSILSQSGSTLTVADNIALTGTVDGVDVSDFYAQRGAVNGLALLDASARLVSTHFPALTGDITTTAGALATTLATVNANVGTFGSTTQSVQVTVNAKGLITAISNQTIAAGMGGSGTGGKIAKFTGANTVGNSIITESGATLSAAGTMTIVGQSDTNQLVVRSHSTQTAGQILIQSSASAELTRLYVNAAGAVALGYQAGNALGAVGETVAIGYQAGLVTTDNGGVYIGYLAGKAVTANGLTVQTNIAIGSGALQTNATGYGNVAIGLESMKVYTGKQSIAIGDRTMLKATTGLYNFAFGEEAVYNLVSGHYNEGIGIQALFSNTGSGNIGVGAWALYSNVSGSDNVVFGTNGAFHNTGSYNVEIGGNVGYNSLGSNSILIGYEAGRTSGSATITDSVYIGYRTGYGASAGNNNVGIGSGALPKTVANAVAVGYQAGKVQTGAGFTAIGYQAGLLSTSGTNSTLIGSGAGASLTTNGGCVMIGYQAGNAETAANKLYIANSSTTTPLIYGDFSTPSLTFHGTVTIADGYNLASGTTTGMKLGTSTSQKLGLWNATPIVQPTTGVAAATFTANSGTAVNDASTFDGYTIKQMVKALRNIGLLA